MNTGINRIRLEFKGEKELEAAFVKSLVLIESDWNLKEMQGKEDIHESYGINRIRLEFKVFNATDSLLCNTVLIESDWNLKLQR